MDNNTQNLPVSLGYDEVVDTISDLLITAKDLRDAFADGFSFMDIPTILSVAPRLQETVRDSKVAIAQFIDLTPEESERAAADIAARTAGVPSQIIYRATEAFSLLAQTYGVVKRAQYLVEDWKRWGQLVAKGDGQ